MIVPVDVWLLDREKERRGIGESRQVVACGTASWLVSVTSLRRRVESHGSELTEL